MSPYYLKMLQAILRSFTLLFPYTFARLVHWQLLSFYNDVGLLDLTSAILPLCICFIDALAQDRHRLKFDDDNDEEPPTNLTGPICVITDCIAFCLFVYKALDLITALYAVFRASGFCGKALRTEFQTPFLLLIQILSPETCPGRFTL